MRPTLTILAALALGGGCGGAASSAADAGCVCVAPQIILQLCPAGVTQLDSVGTTGPCRANGFQVEVLQQEGLCRVVVQFQDGSRQEVEAMVRKRTGCCTGYAPDPERFVAKIPHPACCQDAGGC